MHECGACVHSALGMFSFGRPPSASWSPVSSVNLSRRRCVWWGPGLALEGQRVPSALTSESSESLFQDYRYRLICIRSYCLLCSFLGWVSLGLSLSSYMYSKLLFVWLCLLLGWFSLIRVSLSAYLFSVIVYSTVFIFRVIISLLWLSLSSYPYSKLLFIRLYSF